MYIQSQSHWSKKGVGPVFHKVACCSACPHCGVERIKTTSYAAHVAVCLQNPANNKNESNSEEWEWEKY